MDPLISARELILRLDEPRLRVLDARFELLRPPAGRRLYRQGHVPGAVYVDLDGDLAGSVEEHGGRHPLPDMASFARTLGRRGIGDGHEVVVYDQGGTMFAARAWWMLRYLGHPAVRVLDGGYAAYLAAGGRQDRDGPAWEPQSLSVRLRPEMVADKEFLLRRLERPGLCVVDARAPERYRGEVEPIDPKAGHIPSAINRPYERTMAENGRWLPTEALRRQFRAAAGQPEVVCYCGSGVSAAHDVLALELAGIAGARLYVGSWSDWSSYPELPVAVGEEDAV